MLELTERFSLTDGSESIRIGDKKHAYADLQNYARYLAEGLECRAIACLSASERRRLRVLAAAAQQIAQCLRSTGVKSNV
jgi:hypothetical protein